MPPKARKRAAEGILDADDAAAMAQCFQGKRIKTATKRIYSSRMKIMLEWIRSKHPAAMETDGTNCQLPLPKDAVLGFFGHLIEPAHECDTNNTHADNASSPPLSASCVEGYRSALVDLYRASSLELETSVDKALGRTLDGYVKCLNQLKQRGLMDINEGKRYLKWGGYDLIDQTGAEKYGKYVYANPFEPAKCPILALAVNVFSCPERLGGCHQLFIGKDNKGRFSRAPRKVIASLNEDELRVLGCRSQDIGTHSLRKGSSTYALSHVSGPTPVPVFLRMGQSLGQLKDRYIFYGEGADQLCGRMISGLPFDSVRFGVLPPHFTPTACREFTVEYWNEIVTEHDMYPRSSQAMFPYLLASLLYHESFLREQLCSSHPIFKARVFVNNRLLVMLRDSVILACGSSPVCSMKASGIPPHLVTAAKVNEIGEKFDALESRVMDRLNSQTAHIVDELRQSFEIEGAVPVSMRDFVSLRAELISEIRSLSMGGPGTEPPADVGQQDPVWKSWSWGDGLMDHAVPPEWEFPTKTRAKLMWDLWQFGDKDTGIRPYRLITKKFDIKAHDHMSYHRVQTITEAIEAIAVEESQSCQ